MMSILFFLIIILNEIHGKFLSNFDSSSYTTLRHIRLSTNDEQYHIQCPYDLNYLTLQLLNYSNENCFNLYSISNNNACINHQSPCQFHAKPVHLHCNHHSYSNHVDITYQCSYKSKISSFSFQPHSSDPEETIILFLIGFGSVISIWILISCIWFIHHHHGDDENFQFISHRCYPKDDMNHLCLRINPFEDNPTSSLRTIQII